MKFRKKPVIIDAQRFVLTKDEKKKYSYTHTTFGDQKWIVNNVMLNGTTQYYIMIDTLEGRMKCIEGDWIIRGLHGEYYPCKPDIFKKTYELVKEDEM